MFEKTELSGNENLYQQKRSFNKKKFIFKSQSNYILQEFARDICGI